VLSHNLYLQDWTRSRIGQQRLLVVGEVLWDVFKHGAFLGGAPLNFAAHARRLGHEAILISAVGKDPRGYRAKQEIAALGLNPELIAETARHPTGTATIELDGDGQPRFVIHRPAAYDAIELDDQVASRLKDWGPTWVYYGTLYPSQATGRQTLRRLMDRFPGVPRFYDVNIRPGFDSPGIISELIGLADVAKLNESEVEVVAAITGLPADYRGFCMAGRERYGWRAACVTLGPQGCAILVGDEYVESDGCKVEVSDTVGAGDAFAAAFVHGLAQRWPPAEIAAFANRVGALVASRPGAIPEWTIDEVTAPESRPQTEENHSA
jgi:fructokinase